MVRGAKPSPPPGLLLHAAALKEMQGTQKMASLTQQVMSVLTSAFVRKCTGGNGRTLPDGLGSQRALCPHWVLQGQHPPDLPPWASSALAEVSRSSSDWVRAGHWAQQPPCSVWRVGVGGWGG